MHFSVPSFANGFYGQLHDSVLDVVVPIQTDLTNSNSQDMATLSWHKEKVEIKMKEYLLGHFVGFLIVSQRAYWAIRRIFWLKYSNQENQLGDTHEAKNDSESTRCIFWLLCIFTLLSSFASTCAFLQTTVVFGIISRLNVLSHMPTWWIGSYIAMLPGLANWVDLELILSIHWQHGKSKITQSQHHTNDIISCISKTHHQKRRK